LSDETLVDCSHEEEIEAKVDDEVDTLLATIPPDVDLLVAVTDL
jgi:hypothetical protein